ncbi:hypothetical protein FOCG_16963 [Fusarium oxysporum f. sp. radicis-lycopersici 26381]|nr:hypothetical protein FOWG_13369 [Fusarium oxysporum f. sp. lycopersici MN25]EXL40543.1 hypothetical protein FOCG_16963 [Fusarium oxysporum f. sp. radicis-lycopersici 26381]
MISATVSGFILNGGNERFVLKPQEGGICEMNA